MESVAEKVQVGIGSEFVEPSLQILVVFELERSANPLLGLSPVAKNFVVIISCDSYNCQRGTGDGIVGDLYHCHRRTGDGDGIGELA
jgi:hypothetical protein